MTVIRRAKVTRVSAAPLTQKLLVPKLTPAEERERLLRNRDRRIHGEVEAIFREHGARIFNGDPLRSARGTASGGAS